MWVSTNDCLINCNLSTVKRVFVDKFVSSSGNVSFSVRIYFSADESIEFRFDSEFRFKITPSLYLRDYLVSLISDRENDELIFTLNSLLDRARQDFIGCYGDHPFDKKEG